MFIFIKYRNWKKKNYFARFIFLCTNKNEALNNQNQGLCTSFSSLTKGTNNIFNKMYFNITRSSFFSFYSKFDPVSLPDLPIEYQSQSNNDIYVTNFYFYFYFYFLFINSSSNFLIDLLILHKYVQVILNMNVCKHLFYHLTKKETFHYQQLNINVWILFNFNIKINSIIYILGFLSPDNALINGSRDTFSASKSGGDSVSIERTRKEKFRHALRSISKVAFSQLGLGMLHLFFTS